MHLRSQSSSPKIVYKPNRVDKSGQRMSRVSTSQELKRFKISIDNWNKDSNNPEKLKKMVKDFRIWTETNTNEAHDPNRELKRTVTEIIDAIRSTNCSIKDKALVLLDLYHSKLPIDSSLQTDPSIQEQLNKLQTDILQDRKDAFQALTIDSEFQRDAIYPIVTNTESASFFEQYNEIATDRAEELSGQALDSLASDIDEVIKERDIQKLESFVTKRMNGIRTKFGTIIALGNNPTLINKLERFIRLYNSSVLKNFTKDRNRAEFFKLSHFAYNLRLPGPTHNKLINHYLNNPKDLLKDNKKACDSFLTDRYKDFLTPEDKSRLKVKGIIEDKTITIHHPAVTGYENSTYGQNSDESWSSYTDTVIQDHERLFDHLCKNKRFLLQLMSTKFNLNLQTESNDQENNESLDNNSARNNPLDTL